MAAFDVGFVTEILTWLPSRFTVLDAGPDLPVPPDGRAAAPASMRIALEHVTSPARRAWSAPPQRRPTPGPRRLAPARQR